VRATTNKEGLIDIRPVVNSLSYYKTEICQTKFVPQSSELSRHALKLLESAGARHTNPIDTVTNSTWLFQAQNKF